MLKVSNLSKSYGSRTLLDEVTFSLNSRERLGLVGRNGCGKSTLFKIILEEEHPDSGDVSKPRGYRIGHLAQHLRFTESNILKEVCLGLPEEERDQEYRGEIILSGLGFSDEDFLKAPSEFSGGFQIRLNLAKLLLSEPNLLLLDEPTNYLDIVSIRWLESFLNTWPNEMIIISHDRTFMDSVTTSTMLIHRGTIKKVVGGTDKLYGQVALDEENYEKTRINEDKKRKELELFINRFRAQASKAALVQSKVKALEKMGKSEELADIHSLDFKFCEEPFPGKQMLEVSELSFAYPENPEIITGLDFTIEKKDRICVIGKNGKGKSTLLKLISGELKPSKGQIKVNQNTRIGYFGQTNIDRLSSNLTIEDEVGSINPNMTRTKVRGICGTMMFSGDEALKKISVLSGGEKSRVLLAKILATPTNLLLLDEPTNHLDMESIEALITTLQSYDGAVIIVTHSELILSRLATKLVVFREDSPSMLPHGYDYFLEKDGWGDEQEMSATKKNKSKDKSAKKSNSGVNKNLSVIEKKIFELETEQKRLEAELVKASEKGDYEAIGKLSKSLQQLKESTDENYKQWERISEI